MANLFKERLKAADRQALSQAPERQVEAITFQQRSPSGSFVRTVTAIPGSVTVVRESSKQGQASSFREALLAMDKSANLNIRLGTQEVHPTEISRGVTTAEILKHQTVREALRAVGAPEARTAEILREIGLESAAEASPSTLNAQMLKRLALVASLFHRSRVVHLDRPFSGIDQVWVERLARLLVEAGELPSRVLLITGEARIPVAWKGHQKVFVQDADGISMKLPTPKAVSEGLQNLTRTMLSASGLLREPVGDVVTRPQAIYPVPRSAAHETLQSEAIPNPNVELPQQTEAERARDISASIERVQAERRNRDGEEASHSSRKSPSGKLTKVSRYLRLKQSSPANTLRNATYKVRASFAAGPREEALLPPVKRTMVQVKKLKRRKLIVGASVVATGIVLLWLWGSWTSQKVQSLSSAEVREEPVTENSLP